MVYVISVWRVHRLFFRLHDRVWLVDDGPLRPPTLCHLHHPGEALPRGERRLSPHRTKLLLFKGHPLNTGLHLEHRLANRTGA